MRKLLFLLTLLVAPSAWAQNGLFYAIDPPAPGANLLVCPLPTAGPAPNPCTTAAPIYNDIGLTMPAPNPVTLTQSGTYAFWAAAGQYVIQLSGSVNRTYVISLGGAAGSAGTLPRLDQVLNQNQNKLFNQGTASLSFTNGSFSLAGETAPLALPSINSCSPTVGGQICFDSTATNYLAYNGGVLNFALFPSTVISGDLAGYLLVGGMWTLQDLGPPSGSSTGSFIKVDITNAQVDDSVCISSLGPPIVWVNCTEGVPVNTQSGASYTINCTTDRGSYILLTSSSAIAVSLPQAGVGACDANFFTYIRTLNAVATVTPTTSTIDDGGGAGATLLIQPGYGTNVFSDNTNYFAKIGPYREDSHGLMNVEGFDVNSLGAYQWQSPNNGTTGTTANKMACDDGTGKEIICSHTTAAADVPDGVAVSGVGAAPGTTGNVGICIIGYCSVVFDNSATANHYAQVSTSVDGDLTDVGTTAPTNGQPYYKIFTGNAGAGTQGIIRDLTPSELSATQVGGGGKTTVQVNGVSTQPIVNFNSSTPAAGAGFLATTYDSSNAGNTTRAISKVPISGNTSTLTSAATISGTNPACSDGSGNIKADGTCPAAASGITSINTTATGPAVSIVGAGSANVTTSGNTVTVIGANGPPQPQINIITSTSYVITNAENTWSDKFEGSGGTTAITLPQAGQITASPFVSNRLSANISAAPSATTGTFTQSAGNTEYVFLSWQDATKTVSGTPTSATGDILTLVQPIINHVGTNNANVAVYSITNATASASQTITVTMTGNVSVAVAVTEYTGVVADHAGSNSAVTGQTSVTLSASFTSELAVYWSFFDSSCATGWTQRAAVNGVSLVCDRVFSSVASITAQTAGGLNGIAMNMVDTSTTGVGSFGPGWAVIIDNSTSPCKDITVTPTTSTIIMPEYGNGAGQASVTLQCGKQLRLVSDGTNYHGEFLNPSPSTANISPVTANANVSTDQNLMAFTFPANSLAQNNLGTAITYEVWAAGVYTTVAANTSTLQFKAKMCTVSGCGSGTVITPISVTSSANTGGVTGNDWNVHFYVTMVSSSLSAQAVRGSGNLTVDLGASPGLTSLVFATGGTTDTSTIATTGSVFLQMTGAFSSASGSNSFTEQSLIARRIN